jgi:hypothetical protein
MAPLSNAANLVETRPKLNCPIKRFFTIQNIETASFRKPNFGSDLDIRQNQQFFYLWKKKGGKRGRKIKGNILKTAIEKRIN